MLRQLPRQHQNLPKLFFNPLDHRPAFGILHRPHGHVKIFCRKNVQKLGLFGQPVFPKIRYLLIQPDFFLKDRLWCPSPLELKNEVVFSAVELMPVSHNRVRLVAVE
jgi:hypothetical protein